MKTTAQDTFATDGADRRTQFGALCWRTSRGRTEVLLVTSRETGRWVIPKGWPITGLEPAEVAAREAWEEAGAKGSAGPHCLGFFTYDKVLDRAADPVEVPCVVAVFPMRVTHRDKVFPEVRERRVKWFTPDRAATKVDEPELQTLIAGFTPVRA